MKNQGKESVKEMETYYGLMDIGSNTIHAVVYKLEENRWRKVVSEKEYAELITYVEHGQLSAAGIERLCQALENLSVLFRAFPCVKTFYFATSALRALQNGDAVLQQVAARTGIQITVISGEEEAYYDYVSLKQYLKQDFLKREMFQNAEQCAKQDGTKCKEEINCVALGLDLGGGSGQLFYYTDDILQKSGSYEIGCLRLYHQYVAGVLPTDKERDTICRRVSQLLADGDDFTHTGMDTLYVMGGTGRACAKLYQSLQGQEKAEPCYIRVQQLQELLATVQELGLQGVRIINRLAPERLCSLLPGLLAILTVAQYTGVEQICVIKEGIREGFLVANILEEEHPNAGTKSGTDSI